MQSLHPYMADLDAWDRGAGEDSWIDHAEINPCTPTRINSDTIQAYQPGCMISTPASPLAEENRSVRKLWNAWRRRAFLEQPEDVTVGIAEAGSDLGCIQADGLDELAAIGNERVDC